MSPFRLLACVLLLALGTLLPGRAPAQDGAVPSGVVSVQATRQAFDELLPWIKEAERTVRGNAAVVEGRRLITTADLVQNANLLTVRKRGRYPDYAAQVLLVDYDLNLALLEVNDATFWEGLRPLPLAREPVRSGRFAINRWRANGRFERGTGEVVDFLVSNSPFGLMEYPVMRATTSMGGLGWSEVLTVDGAVIGLITSHDGQQIRTVNSDMLRLLVQAARRESVAGFAHRGFAWQQLNQSHLRAFLGLEEGGTGVLVRKLFAGGTGAGALQPLDILHRINGYDIDPEGRIDHPDYGPLLFTMAINESLAPTLEAEIQRDGERRVVSLRRSRFGPDDYRVPPPTFGGAEDFQVFGGLVLRELSAGYLRAWGEEWRTNAPTRLVIEYSLHSLRGPEESPERVLIISRVLPDPANLGYENVGNAIVKAVNGRSMHSLADFRAAIRHPVEGYHRLELLPGSGRTSLVYDAAELEAVNARVRKRYAIPPR